VADLLRLCHKMPRSAWKSVHSGSHNWLPEQCHIVVAQGSRLAASDGEQAAAASFAAVVSGPRQYSTCRRRAVGGEGGGLCRSRNG
jgi:hypothetical protein